MYKKDQLREYIENSELRIFSDDLHIRLSKKLSKKYDNGNYNVYLEFITDCWNKLKTLNIEYPGKASPILYIYIVPDDKYVELLRYPDSFNNNKGGGKPVGCYDLDGFNLAFGMSQNLLENVKREAITVSEEANIIHELAHVIHGQFFVGNEIICEGTAEAISLYALDYEKNFLEYSNMLKTLSEDQISSAEEVLKSERESTFGNDAILPNKSCSFRLSYISSYLFVKFCLFKIIKQHNLTKQAAVQKFLEIVKQSDCSDEWLIYDIANAIGVDMEELLTGKSGQIQMLSEY